MSEAGEQQSGEQQSGNPQLGERQAGVQQLMTGEPPPPAPPSGVSTASGVLVSSLLVVAGVVAVGYLALSDPPEPPPGAESAVPLTPATPAAPAPETSTAAPPSRPAPASARTSPSAAAGRAKVMPSNAANGVDRATMAAAITVHQTLRAQLALYRLQHRDAWPDLVGRGWAQLLRPTRADGRVADDGEYGPYIQRAPVNPLNGLAGLHVVRGVKPGELPAVSGKGAGTAGFLYEPATGQFWLTDVTGTVAFDAPAAQRAIREADRRKAAAAPGPDSDLTPEGRREHLAITLQLLRAQIELYKLQHDDVPPDLVRYPGWAQLRKPTAADGTPDERGEYGPYLLGKTVNRVNNSAAVLVVERMPAQGAKARGAKMAGFFYERPTGLVCGTDERGALVHDAPVRRLLARRTK